MRKNFLFWACLIVPVLTLMSVTGCYHRERLKDTRCGDGVCDTLGGENRDNCPRDCSTIKPVCGDGICQSNETADSCPADCAGMRGRYCGNGICDFGEDHNNCPDDCPVLSAVCGDGRCEPGETAETCPSDCKHR